MTRGFSWITIDAQARGRGVTGANGLRGLRGGDHVRHAGEGLGHVLDLTVTSLAKAGALAARLCWVTCWVTLSAS